MTTRQFVQIIVVLVVLCRISEADAALLFNDPPRRRHRLNNNIKAVTVVGERILSRTTYNNKLTKEDSEVTWSKAGNKESRLGVRKRVRAVLARARERTGVSNYSKTSSKEEANQILDTNIGLAAALGEWSFSSGRMNDENNSFGTDILGSDATLNMGLSYDSKRDIEYTRVERLKPRDDSGNDSKSANSSRPDDADNTSTKIRDSSSSEANKDKLISDAAQQPLPFALPTLSLKQKEALLAWERVQEQSKMGGEGSGFVVMDIPAPEYAIWEVLLDFESYPENIGTVRSMTMFTNTHLGESFIAEKPMPRGAVVRHYGKASISRAKFVLSKFRLNIAAIHRYQPHPDGHYMVFQLDKACQNLVLQDAKGIWYTESNPDGREGVTRVWLLCELKVSPLLPTFIVDYAAKRAMPRATTWLPTTVEKYLEREREKI